MSNIFGDTHDIAFGTFSDSKKTFSEKLRPNSVSSIKPVHSPAPAPTHRRPADPRKSAFRERLPGTSTLAPTPKIPKNPLIQLVESMKPSFLPQNEEGTLRFVLLSEATASDPFFLLRHEDTTLLFGTGFGTVEMMGTSYPTFPDMRLAYSERDRIAGWIMLDPDFSIEPFRMILEWLGFPHVYGSREVIAKIRDSIKDQDFLDRCRFFELFSPSTPERKIADITLSHTEAGVMIATGNASFIDGIHGKNTVLSGAHALRQEQDSFLLGTSSDPIEVGEIIELKKSLSTKHSLRFTFDTFFLDKNSVGLQAGYALKDRKELAENGVLTFVIEEDGAARAIVGHIFIDSRGFVHSHEMMSVHKEILKGIRHTYEQSILANPRIERGELVQTFRREITKYCYLLTGRTPVVMPIIIER